MKKQSIHSEKKLISNFIFFLFFIIIIGVGYMSDTMKIPLKTHTDFIEETQAFNSKELANITRVHFKNTHGEFNFEKNIETNKWNLVEGENLKESAFMDKLYANLQVIKTKNVLEETTENLTNFSLIEPNVTLTLNSPNPTEEIIVHFGLMNTIDSSTYMSFKNKKGIFHVEAPATALDNITIADLIETRPFEFTPADVVKIKLTSLLPKPETHEFEKINGLWSKQADIDLNQAMIDQFLNDLIAIKSSKVLIGKTKAQDQNLKNLLKKYPYDLSIGLDNDKVIHYKVSATTKSFSEISLNDEHHYLVTRSDNDSIHFIRSNDQMIFNIGL